MKNLLDVEKEIHETISYINKNNEHITSVEINKCTLDYLKSKGIYKFADTFNKEIPIIINELLIDNQIKFNREKNNEITNYVPFEIIN